MSTNYWWIITAQPPAVLATGERVTLSLDYDDPRVHIGKSWGRGAGKGFGFMWAQDPQGVRAALLRCASTQVVEDEYDQRYTGAEFLAVVERVSEHVVRVGERFT